MDETATDKTKQGLGYYGETLAARHLTGTGMVLLERNWGTTTGEIDLLLREGDVLVVCEVKTRTSDACGLPHEAVDAAKVERLRRVADEWLAATRPTLATSASTWWRCGGPGRVRQWSSTCGGSADVGRDGLRHLPPGAVGHLIEVQADVSSGLVGTTVVGRADVAINEARDRCRMAIVNSALAGRRPSASRSCSRRQTWPSAAPTSTWPSPWPCWPPTARSGGPVERVPVVGEPTLSGRLRSVPGVLPMVLAASRHGIRQAFGPERQVREAAMVPGSWCSACGRWPRSRRRAATSRSPRPRRWPASRRAAC